MKVNSQHYIPEQYIRSIQTVSISSQVSPIPSNLLPFFLKRVGVDYLGKIHKTRGWQEFLTLYLLKDKVISTGSQTELLSELTTVIETKTLMEAGAGNVIERDTTSSQYLGDFEKLEPLCIQDIDLHSDVNKIIRNLKRPQGAPYLLSLAGKLDGPRDLSENKGKYLAKNVKQKPKS